ncbi:DNA-directed RNA polymerase III subunit RPC4 [Platysternon megacephalum]|uniref:DNA-directed RNA polymerase III subunit RPC4 n=1 Tax=Platysternon megacephalum TaxID=55544 RepID=A0A4D9ENW8_9SAUR|nr:DNA-directed RNA polymerase III subunit RPC4 [Platysternon megacephalum]
MTAFPFSSWVVLVVSPEVKSGCRWGPAFSPDGVFFSPGLENADMCGSQILKLQRGQLHVQDGSSTFCIYILSLGRNCLEQCLGMVLTFYTVPRKPSQEPGTC